MSGRPLPLSYGFSCKFLVFSELRGLIRGKFLILLIALCKFLASKALDGLLVVEAGIGLAEWGAEAPFSARGLDVTALWNHVSSVSEHPMARAALGRPGCALCFFCPISSLSS